MGQPAGASVFWSPRNWEWPRPARLAPPWWHRAWLRSHVHLLRPRETIASGGACPLEMTPDGIAELRGGSVLGGYPEMHECFLKEGEELQGDEQGNVSIISKVSFGKIPIWGRIV